MASPVLSVEMRGLNWQSVSSSNVSAIAYVPDFGRLWVSFHNGSIYVYYNVPVSVWQGMQNASSKGGYLARHIKGMFGYQKIV